MNTPHDPHDPLLESLAEEAADLPLRAAREARSRNTHHMRQRFRAASAVTILFVVVCSWSLITAPAPPPEFAARQSASSEPVPEKEGVPPEPIAPISPTSPSAPEASGNLSPSPTLAYDPSKPLPREFVKMQTEDEAMNNPLPLPEGLDREQEEVFKAARGLPLLLVRDNAGKVLRIHVIER